MQGAAAVNEEDEDASDGGQDGVGKESKGTRTTVILDPSVTKSYQFFPPQNFKLSIHFTVCVLLSPP